MIPGCILAGGQGRTRGGNIVVDKPLDGGRIVISISIKEVKCTG